MASPNAHSNSWMRLWRQLYISYEIGRTYLRIVKKRRSVLVSGVC